MNRKEIDCTYAEQNDLAALYLAGKLLESDAEAFEAHYFTCESCWSDVRRGGEIRAAFGEPAVASPTKGLSGPSRHDVWPLLAAAAAVAMIALGIRQLSPRPEIVPPEPTYRGERSEALILEIATRPTGQIRLSWSAIEDAHVFVVQVFASDGVSVWKRETSETYTSLERSALPPPRAGISFLAQVEALDTMRQVVAKSDLRPLSIP